MKHLLLPFFLFFIAASFAQNTLRTDSVYITGKIGHFEKYKDSANSVSFIVNDIALGDQLTHRVKVNNDGLFKITFPKTGTQDIYIEYNNALETIIVSPGDHMQVIFDGVDVGKTLTFKGDNAQTNIDLKAYEIAFDKESEKIYGAEQSARAMKNATSIRDLKTGEEYTRFKNEQFKYDSTFLATYIAQHTLSPTFIKWAQADQKYAYAWELMRYPWLHPRYANFKDGSFKVAANYYSFLNRLPVDDASMSVSSSFGGYMDEYRGYTVKKSLGEGYKPNDAIILLTNRQAGFSRDVLLCLQFSSLIHNHRLQDVKPNIPLFEKKVSNIAFKEAVLASYRKAAGIMNTTDRKKAKPLSEADSLFNKIIAKYPNKVVYVDFWATWCGPCRAEMPNSKKLRTLYNGKDVVFLYLGVQSPEKAWKDMIVSLDIRGENILLNKNEFAALAEKFQISGIPRYILVNKKGQVVDDNAKRPGDSSLRPQIQKLLGM